MSDLPERIWLTKPAPDEIEWTSEKRDDADTLYLRSDLVGGYSREQVLEAMKHAYLLPDSEDTSSGPVEQMESFLATLTPAQPQLFPQEEKYYMGQLVSYDDNGVKKFGNVMIQPRDGGPAVVPFSYEVTQPETEFDELKEEYAKLVQRMDAISDARPRGPAITGTIGDTPYDASRSIKYRDDVKYRDPAPLPSKIHDQAWDAGYAKAVFDGQNATKVLVEALKKIYTIGPWSIVNSIAKEALEEWYKNDS